MNILTLVGLTGAAMVIILLWATWADWNPWLDRFSLLILVSLFLLTVVASFQVVVEYSNIGSGPDRVEQRVKQASAALTEQGWLQIRPVNERQLVFVSSLSGCRIGLKATPNGEVVAVASNQLDPTKIFRAPIRPDDLLQHLHWSCFQGNQTGPCGWLMSGSLNGHQPTVVYERRIGTNCQS
ncbi:MAG TPA: hypothetical protein VGA08_03285 [Candidatus Saccharimonadales bacterium]